MIECGFFDSVDKDRLYKAETMTRPYELLVSNGVFATPNGTPSNYLQVYAGPGMDVIVKPGRGIFKDKWLINDSDLVLTVGTASATMPRIDSVIVRIDTSEAVRSGTITIKQGTAASSPTPPVMERTSNVHEYRLADIRVNAAVTDIMQPMITDRRGSADCPWVTSLIKQVDTSTLFEQFQTGFDDWFSNVKETLATSTLIRSYESTYTTIAQDETTIPIAITQFNRNLDILQVYINGLMLIKGVEYTVTDDTAIELTNGVDVGTSISFVVYKSIDGSDAETAVQQVYELQQDMLNTVKKTGTETISGVKTFTNDPYVQKISAVLRLKNTNLVKDTKPAAVTYSGMNAYDNDMNQVGSIRYVQNLDGEGYIQLLAQNHLEDGNAEVRLYNVPNGDKFLQVPRLVKLEGGYQAFYTDGSTNMQIGSGNLPTKINAKDDIFLNARANTFSLVPNANATYQIGNTSFRYNGIYLVNTPNVSSDRRLKENIESVRPSEELAFIDQLDVVRYRYKSDPDTERVGLIAQDVYDAGGERYVEIDKDGMYSLKPMDLIYPLIASVQQLSSENKALNDRIQSLEERIKALEN